jgi:hypothetical protein
MIKSIILIIVILINMQNVSCKEESSNTHLSNNTEKPDKKGFWKEAGCFYIKYKSVIFEFEGKSTNIPIFGGSLPSVRYSDLKKLHDDPNEYLLGGICIKPPSGHVKETVEELIEFYSKELMGGKKNHTIIGGEGGTENDGGEYIVWYDFKLNNEPASLMIKFPAKIGAGISEKIRIGDLEVDETGASPISISIDPLESSPFFEE